jgi:hypothetical protein
MQLLRTAPFCLCDYILPTPYITRRLEALDRLCGPVVRVLATDPEARVRFPELPEKM